MSEKEDEERIKRLPVKVSVSYSQKESVTEIVKQGIVSIGDILEEYVSTGENSLMQAYASTMWLNSIFHSANLIDDRSYESVFVLDTIMQAIAVSQGLAGIFTGAQGPFKPTATTLVKARKTRNEPRTEAREEGPTEAIVPAGEIAAAAKTGAALAPLV